MHNFLLSNKSCKSIESMVTTACAFTASKSMRPRQIMKNAFAILRERSNGYAALAAAQAKM